MDKQRTGQSALRWSAFLVAASLTGCGSMPMPASSPRPMPPAPTPPRAPLPVAAPAPPAVVPAPPVSAPTVRARNWNEYREQAARRMVQLNPGKTYMTDPPEPLMAIPVLEVELNADGSIASIRVERYPREVKQTAQMAIEAVRRAAPFGPVSHLPKPWRFTEVFLYDYEFRFKPRSLD